MEFGVGDKKSVLYGGYMNKLNKELLLVKLENLGMNLENFVDYNSKIFFRLLNKYDAVDIVEEFYCCNGLERSCWVEPHSEGINGSSIKQVKKKALRISKECSKYLYENKKYGNRVFVLNEEDNSEMFIYLRDIIGRDFIFSFYNN